MPYDHIQEKEKEIEPFQLLVRKGKEKVFVEKKVVVHLILDTLMTLCKGDSDKNVKKYPQRFHLEPQDKIKVLTSRRSGSKLHSRLPTSMGFLLPSLSYRHTFLDDKRGSGAEP